MTTTKQNQNNQKMESIEMLLVVFGDRFYFTDQSNLYDI